MVNQIFLTDQYNNANIQNRRATICNNIKKIKQKRVFIVMCSNELLSSKSCLQEVAGEKKFLQTIIFTLSFQVRARHAC